MTPIQTLYTHLDNAGLFGVWTDPFGNQQEPVKVQMREFNETAQGITNDTRILLIKSIGNGGGTRYVSGVPFVFAVMGKVSESDEVFVEAYASLVYQSLLDFDHDGCITNIEPLGGVNGSYKMESGRSAYDSEWTVNIDNGRVQF